MKKSPELTFAFGTADFDFYKANKIVDAVENNRNIEVPVQSNALSYILSEIGVSHS